ncbi:MAG: fumarylacetoacetate hydrolase family protein [Steroidobacteraceae bacterium]
MPESVFPAAPRTVVPVARRDAVFPVRRIHCVGRNYAAHAREMGADAREPPFFFQKPTDAIVLSGSAIDYPSATQKLHHEVELVLAIGQEGAAITVADARRHVFGVAVGIDLTRRDLQEAAKQAGKPWETGKAFDASAPIGAIRALAEGEPLPCAGRIALSVNDEVRQEGDLADMIWRCDEIVARLSCLYRLEAGDLIYTGTPSGVGPLRPGDRVVAQIEGLDPLVLSISAPS